jgi:hypothetical protein
MWENGSKAVPFRQRAQHGGWLILWGETCPFFLSLKKLADWD